MTVKLPIYERQVGTAQFQAPRVQAATSAAGADALARGIEQAGNAASNITQNIAYYQARATAKADALRVDLAKQQVQQAKEQLLTDPDGGFLTTKLGENAIKESQSYKDQFANITKRLAADLSPSQRAAFDAVAVNEATSLEHTINQHVAAQSDALEQQTSQAIFNGKASEAASAAVRGDTGGMNDAISAGLGHLDQLAQRNGWTPEIRQAKEREYTSSTRLGILETLVGADQADKAQQLLHQWAPELNQQDLTSAKLRDRIDGAVLKSKAQELATTAWSVSGNDVGKASDVVATTDIKDPKLRDLAQDLVRKQADAYHGQLKAADGDGLARIGETVARGKGKFSVTDLDTHPDFLKLNLQDSRTKALQMVNAEARRASNDESWRRIQRELDAAGEAEFRADAANDPESALDVNIADKYAHLTNTARSRIRERQGKLREDVQSGEAVKATDFMRMVNSRIGPKTPKAVSEKIRDSMLQWYEGRRSELKGKEPPIGEAQRYLEDQFTQGQADHWYGNPNRTRIEAAARGETWIPPKGDDPPRTPAPQGRREPPPEETVRMRAPDGRALNVPKSKVDQMLKAGARPE